MWPRILIACFAFLLVACQASPPIPTAEPTLPPSSPTAVLSARPTVAALVQSTAAPTIVPTVVPTARTARASDILYVEESDGTGPNRLAVVDAATGEQLRTLPRGVPSPDWSTLYTAECRADKTIVSAIAVASGQTVGSTSLDGCYSLPSAGISGVAGLSPHGNWLSLT